MSESTPKKKRLRGFASILAKQLGPLNEIDYFKEKFKDTNVKLLLNATDGKIAALIIIDKGTLSIESIPNTPKKSLKKKVLGWNGKLETKTLFFLDIAVGKLGIGGIVKKVLSRKIKIRGIRKLLILLKMFNILEYEAKKAKSLNS